MPKASQVRFFTKVLLEWHYSNPRNLPWKENPSAYKIWLSEIIMQQTQVIQGTKYYIKFIETYPFIEDLAAAPEEEVLSLWQGLGYYSRARNLLKTAKIIANDFNGQFPEQPEELQRLPGIGPYTAAAIASFAFGVAIPVVDGNVYRVLSRYFGDEMPQDLGKRSYDYYEALSLRAMNLHHDPAEFNQAIMNFGALQCKPKAPDCTYCPLQQNCIAYETQTVQVFPKKAKAKRVKKKRYLNFLVLEQKEGIWLEQRQRQDIWAKMFQPFLVEAKSLKNTSLKDSFDINLQTLIPEKEIVHQLTHQTLYIKIFHLFGENFNLDPSFRLVEKNKILEKALPQPLYLYFKEIISSNRTIHD